MKRNHLTIKPVELRTVLGLAASLVLLGTVLVTAPAAHAQAAWYVDDDAPLGGSGTSWLAAFKYLQDALAVAEDDDQIRVAEGVYTPDQDEAGNVTPGDRYASFELVSGVAVYGGYAGLGAENPNERDVEQYETVLSGDLNGDDGPDFTNYDDNSRHVVFGAVLDKDTILDGLVVTSGFANGSGLHGYGGGLFLEGGAPAIGNCTFCANWAEWGGAMYSEAAATMVACRFVGNQAYDGEGGALLIVFAPIALVDCVFDRNTSLSEDPDQGGGAISATLASVSATNCVFAGNLASGLGGAIDTLWSPTTLVNCTFSGNAANDAGAVAFDTMQLTVINSAFSANTAGASYGGIQVLDGQATVVNCILWNNSDTGGTQESAQIVNTGDGSIAVSYACIQNYTGTYGDTGTIADDPLFVDADGADDTVGTPDDDLSLAPGSPCIDAGNNEAVPWDLDDLDGDGVIAEPLPIDLAGNPRFVDDPDVPDTGFGFPPIVDMGALERVPVGIVTSVGTLGVPEGGTATFSVWLTTAPEEPVTVTVTAIAGDPDITVEEGASLAFDADNFGVPQPVTLAAALDEDDVHGLTVIEVAGPGYSPIYVIAWEVDAEASPVVIFVNAAAPSGGDGTSWETAFNDLQDALDAAVWTTGNVEIWVAAGTYTPDRGTGDRSATFELLSRVALLGGFAGSEDDADQRDPVVNLTVLSGDLGASRHSYHVVSASWTGESAVLDGFTICGGRAQNSPGMEICGGGLMLAGASPTIRDCAFAENEGSSGGALENTWFGHPTLVGCTFIGNEAVAPTSWGGAIHSWFAQATLKDCVFIGNLATDGGAIDLTEGYCWLANCRFLGNTATGCGGALNALRCEVYLVNCTLGGNDGYGAAYFDRGWGTLVNCDFSRNHERGLVIAEEADVGVYNSVLWENSYNGTMNEDAQVYLTDDNSELDIRYSCVQGWTGQLGGIGNIGDDPLFIDADGEDDLVGTEDDDLHLSPGSPCIDSGSNFFVPPDRTDLDDDGDTDEYTPLDLDGEGRFFDDPNTPDGGGGYIAIVDMGAYEFGGTGPQPNMGDLNGDGETGWEDLAILLSNYGMTDGAQLYEGDIDGDTDIDLIDLALLLSVYGRTW